MERGYQQVMRHEGRSLDDVFDDLERKYARCMKDEVIILQRLRMTLNRDLCVCCIELKVSDEGNSFRNSLNDMQVSGVYQMVGLLQVWGTCAEGR